MEPNSRGKEKNDPATEQRFEALARQLALAALDGAVEQASEIVAHQKLGQEKFNLPEITARRARYDSLYRRRSEVLQILRLSPSDNPASLVYKRWFYRAFAFTLVLAGIFFAHLSLAPFGLGRETWVVCIGMGLVGMFWTERTLEKINCEPFLKCICVLSLIASLLGLLVLALLRGDILALYLQSTVEMIANSSELGTSFYAHAIWKLQMLMGLLAIAMELASGMAMFEAGKLDLAGYERAKLTRKELDQIEGEMGSIIGRITYLEQEPAIKEAEFWVNFRIGLFERIKKTGIRLLLLLALLYGFGLNATAATGSAPSVVIALDLTQSVGGKGYDGKTDYDKNIDAACELIASLPAGARLTVLAITDRSFAQPYILLQRRIPSDKGPLQFQDRIALARTHAASELRKVASSSPHSNPHTDILGALIVAADLLRQSPYQKVLVLLSDMRQSTSEVDLERPNTIAQAQVLAAIRKRGAVAQLQDVEIYAVGVDATGKSLPYWNSLRDFWESYFREAGAHLKRYSTLREVPDLESEVR